MRECGLVRIDSFSKKQKIILIVLLAVTAAVAAVTVVLALPRNISCRAMRSTFW